jgi:hypothetical protein
MRWYETNDQSYIEGLEKLAAADAAQPHWDRVQEAGARR